MTKRLRKPLTVQELADYPITSVVDGWFFQVREVSQGFYIVKGVDSWGRSISRQGIDPEDLLLSCKNDISEMMSNS